MNTTADHDDGRCQPLAAGDCTLREAMDTANREAGPDVIRFDIPTDDPGYDPDTGKWTIDTLTALPPIDDDGTTIDGGASDSPTSQGTGGAASSFCKPISKVIILKAAVTQQAAHGALQHLHLLGPTSGDLVAITGSNAFNNTVRCNLIERQILAAPFDAAGVYVSVGAHDNKIDANTMCNHREGVHISVSAEDNVVTRNWIGAVGAGSPFGPLGCTAVGNDHGVVLGGGAQGNIIGHPTDPTLGNVISGNDLHGVWIWNAGPDNIVRDNRIGIDRLTDQPNPNGGAGVFLSVGAENTVGRGNVIAYNKGGGVVFASKNPPGRNEVTWNSIFDNLGKGIVNPRTPPPIITAVGPTAVGGTTNPTCVTCSVEIFANPSHSAVEPAEGKTPIGWAQTQSDGTWTWSGTVSQADWITATLTDNGDTSEFSAPRRLMVSFSGKTCPPAQPIIQCIPGLSVTLLAKIDDKWTKIDSVPSGEDGSFTLTDDQSVELPEAYRVVMADPHYSVESADPASGGELLPDGSIRFTPTEPASYDGTIFYVEQVASQEWVVNTTADHDDGRCEPLGVGDCTLREALQVANERGQADTIVFTIPEGDPGYEDGRWRIQPQTSLPDLTADGLTIGTCTAQIFVVLDGTLMPPGMSGFTVTGAQLNILGLMLSNWPAHGVRITGAAAYENTIACNLLLDNLGDGLRIEAGAEDNTVGGPLGGNVISGNGGHGVHITGTGTDSNNVIGNYIGTDQGGMTARGNTGHGVRIAAGASYNDVGGELAPHRNVIAGNGHSGVMIEGSNTGVNRVGANLIGVAADGSTPLGNGHHGVGIYADAVVNMVGGGFLLPNVIGANGWSGVAVVGSFTNAVLENYIGTGAGGITGNNSLGNAAYGVHVVDSADTTINSNIVAYNGADGVRVQGAAAVRNRITLNAITANGGKGIELMNGGNKELAAPVITTVTSTSVSGTACSSCVVEIFSDPADEGQYVHSPPDVTADRAGNWTWTGSTTGQHVTATATDAAGNTSEFATVGWVFTGRIDVTPDSQSPWPLPIEVSLYGSQDSTELGQRLVSTPTDGTGAYELRYRDNDNGAGEYAFLNIVAADPAYEFVSAESISGLITAEGWVQFTAVPPGLYVRNDYRLFAGGIPGPDPKPTVLPLKLPKNPGPYFLIQEEDFVIDGIEVTQAIQCFDTSYQGQQSVCADDNALPLAAGKVAVVRVYATTDRSCSTPAIVAGARVDLTVTWDTGGFSTFTEFKVPCVKRVPAPAINMTKQRREGNAGSANFYLNIPTDRTVHLSAEINPNHTWPEPDYTNNRYPATGTVDVEFKKRDPLSVAYVLVDYHPKPTQQGNLSNFVGTSKPNATWAASASAHAFYDTIFPSGSVTYSKLGTGWLYYTGTDVREAFPVCGSCALLTKLTKDWQAWKLSGQPVPDQFFAWLPDQATAGVDWDGVADAPPPVYTGQGRAALGEEGDSFLLAHEVAHNLKLFHAPCPPAGAPGAPVGIDASWPYADGFIQEVGFDVAQWQTHTPGAPDFTPDFMSYCVLPWISPYHWKQLFDELAPSASGAGAARQPQPYVLVSGSVADDDTGQLDPLVLLDSNGEPPALPSGDDYCIAFYAAAGATLATHCFDVSFAHPETGESTGVVPFAHALPYPASAARAALLHGDTVLAEQVASPSAPELTITAPVGGENWDGIQTVAWTAGDVDGDALTFALFYSADDGATWLPVVMDLTDTTYALDTTALPGSDQVRIRVQASDGFNTTTVDTPSLSVGTKAPEVFITTPADGAVLRGEQATYLHGSAHDAEDGPLAAQTLSWWSDRDGLLGRGTPLLVPGLTLTPGSHRVTLQAADSDGELGSRSVDIFVRAPVPCSGDCNDNAAVTVDELITMVNVALGTVEVGRCPPGDVNGNTEITVDEILTAVNNLLNDCVP